MAEHPLDAAGEFRVIAPNTKTTRTFSLVFVFLTIVGGLISFTSVAHGLRAIAASRALGTGLVLLLSGGLFAGFLWLFSANTRLLIGRGAVGYRSLFRRTRYWSRGEISRVVDMAINHGWWASQPQRAIYFFGLDGKQLFVLTPRAWRSNELADFVNATGVHIEHRDTPVPIRELRREFPRGFGWGSQHVLIATSITMVAAVVLVVGGYALVMATLRK